VIGWLDCTAGASGDMLLGAIVDAGVPLSTLEVAVDAVEVEPIRLTVEPVTRGGLGATRVHVEAPRSTVTRTWPNIRDLLERAGLADQVRSRALDVFARLAAAEARAHRVAAEQVHFHEVGALDAIADVVGVCAGVHALGLTRISAGRVTLGSGVVRGEHGLIPVPAPAVLELLSEVDAPVWAGPAPYEMCTPTGAALLAAHVSTWEPMPPMNISRTGTGAGRRELDELPNLVRFVLGEPIPTAEGGRHSAVIIETNVDDMDPRLWPGVLDRLLEAGASDAWLTPILMKKGRPAHTLHVLCGQSQTDTMRRIVFAETSTIGVRQTTVDKYALDRETVSVDIDGNPVRVKIARLDGEVTNVSVEHDDVAAAAALLGRSVKAVLAAATDAARALVDTP
jgi:uncharacterized protein (TIGR00299 family) protein